MPEGWTPHIERRAPEQGFSLEGLFDDIDPDQSAESLGERPDEASDDEQETEDAVDPDRIGDEPSELPFADDEPSKRGDDVQADAPELALGEPIPETSSSPLPLVLVGLALLALAVTAVAVTKNRNN